MENFLELKAACSFPWLLSNVADRGSGQPLAGCLRSTVLEWRGVRVGLLGELCCAARRRSQSCTCIIAVPPVKCL